MSQEADKGISSRPSAGLLRLVERPSRQAASDSRQSGEKALSSPSAIQTAQGIWQTPRVEYPDQACFSMLFRQQVEKQPGAIAVVEGDTSVTYGELDEMAERMARHLWQNGARPDEPVAVLAERGWRLLAVVLAIWKTGGIYVPLDPLAPAGWLRRVLEHSGSHILLTPAEGIVPIQQALAEQTLAHLPTVLVLEELLQKEAPEFAAGEFLASQGAYILYTLDAQAEARGTLIEQRGLLNGSYALLQELEITERDRVAQVAPVCQELSIWQMLAPLLTGAQVEIFADSVVQNPLSLLQQVAARQVTLLQLVPSSLRTLLEKLEPIETFLPALADLRLLLLTGETLPAELCRRWLKLYPRIALLNVYGLLEYAGGVAFQKVSEPPQENLASVPPGRPLANRRLYVLDETGTLVSPGEVGEIYVGGADGSRGYLGDPAQTAEAFVPDPFAEEDGARLYRTGDRGTWQTNGILEYRERLDRQGNIRGYRLEPGAVETRLAEHPAVLSCAVLLKTASSGQKQLLAYVVLHPEEVAPDGHALRESLQQKLPEYMLPQLFVFLEQLPVLPNGELDQQTLLVTAPDTADMEVKPRTPLEEVLAMLWSEVLGSEPASVASNFFECGGHSLLALELMARAGDLFDLEMPLAWLFENPTIEGLARMMLKDESRREHVNIIARSLIDVVDLSNDEVETLLQALD